MFGFQSFISVSERVSVDVHIVRAYITRNDHAYSTKAESRISCLHHESMEQNRMLASREIMEQNGQTQVGVQTQQCSAVF